jgi:hypothetical protein
LIFGVFDFQRTKLGVFFLSRPFYSAPGKANDADNDEDDADDSSWFHSASLQRSAPADQLQNQYDQRDQEQDMDISAQNVEADKSQQPKNQQNDKYSPKHKNPFVLRLLPLIRFAMRTRA